MKSSARRVGSTLFFLLCAGLASAAPTPVADVVHFYHADPLGSVRAVTSMAGEIVSRHDYLPFGEEIPCDVSGRDAFGYCDDNSDLHVRFTGKERDRESELDYFGARYLSAAQARFTSADPFMNVPENIGDPQRWNRYAYVRNNPFAFVDPDGRDLKSFLLAAAIRTYSFGSGVSNAIVSNHMGGLGRTTGNSDFRSGQTLGDAASIPIGVGVAIHGAMVAKAGAEGTLLLSPTGLGSLAGAAVVAVGVAEVGVGASGVINGANNLMSRNNDGTTGKTPHAEQRAAEARAGDTHRQVGDPNRVVREGRGFLDTESGNHVYVRGNRAVVVDPQTGQEITKFKNTRANTLDRMESGRWVPLPEQQ
jgi:RHS repeat-associated protein